MRHPAHPLLLLSALLSCTGNNASTPWLPEMMEIAASPFQMGCNTQRVALESDGCMDDQLPLHTVNLAAFVISRTEITIAQFRAFTDATHYQTHAERQGSCYGDPSGTSDWDLVKGNSWRKPGFPQTEQDPVVCVSWEDTQAYLAWLNKQTGKQYRLPSEAEWEYAARGSNPDSPYPWGKTAATGCKAANMADQHLKTVIPNWQAVVAECNDGYTYTAPVASFTANAYGLTDMHGNVWEWVQDCYHENYTNAPADGSAWQEPDCGNRVLRGGSWFGEPGLLSSSNRFGFEPATADFSVGFRIAH